MTLEPRIAALLLALASLLLLATGLRALRGRPVLAAAGGLVALALLAVSGLCAALAVSVHGYRALTREEVAAVVEIEPLARQRFLAAVTLADGRSRRFELAGDELYVDARVLKWSPWANLLGLHTSYALDRIAGRYSELEDERLAPRTVHSLVDGAPGSATFAAADRPAALEVRVSTTGLLLREQRGPR